MDPDNRYRNTFISLIMAFHIVAFIFLLSYPLGSLPFKRNLGISVYFTFSIFCGLLIAVPAVILRLFAIVKRKSFFYNFIGTFNFLMAVIGWVIVFFRQGDESWKTLLPLVFLLGLLILADVYFDKIKASIKI